MPAPCRRSGWGVFSSGAFVRVAAVSPRSGIRLSRRLGWQVATGSRPCLGWVVWQVGGQVVGSVVGGGECAQAGHLLATDGRRRRAGRAFPRGSRSGRFPIIRREPECARNVRKNISWSPCAIACCSPFVRRVRAANAAAVMGGSAAPSWMRGAPRQEVLQRGRLGRSARQD